MKRALGLVVLAACAHAAPAASVALAPAPPSAAARSWVRVRFEGVHEVAESALRGAVELDALAPHHGVNTDAMERGMYALEVVLWNLGYLECKVNEPRAVDRPDGTVEVTFVIHEGKRFRIGKAAFHDRDAAPLDGLREVRAGEWFSRRALADDVSRVLRTYHDAGYASAEVTPSMPMNDAAGIVDVTIEVVRGPVVAFRAIEVFPESAAFLRDQARELGVVPGARYSETSLRKLKEAIGRRGVPFWVGTSSVEGHPEQVDLLLETR